jgi:hypothetical protein
VELSIAVELRPGVELWIAVELIITVELTRAVELSTFEELKIAVELWISVELAITVELSIAVELSMFEELEAAGVDEGFEEEAAGVVDGGMEGAADELEDATAELCGDEDGIEMTVDEDAFVDDSETTVVEEIALLVGELDGAATVDDAPENATVELAGGVTIDEDDDMASVYAELDAACEVDAGGVYAEELEVALAIVLEPKVVVWHLYSVTVDIWIDVTVFVMV